MKIAINARTLKAVPDDGISRFTYEIVKRITRNNPSHSFYLIFDKEFDNSLLFSEKTEGYVLQPSARHPVLWYYWHEWQLPGLLKKIGADVFLSPDGIISLRSEIPAISVIHDINFYHRPHDLPWHINLYYRYFFRKFVHKAARIATVSMFSKNDISSYLEVDPDLIDVVYNGVSECFKPADKPVTNRFRDVLTGGSPYFLFVGNFSPRKNISGIIKAYNRFRNVTGLKHKLVLTGARLYLNNETDRLIRSSPWLSDIILTGPKIHEDLKLLYSSAAALIFIPWFEGFGIPAVEAMRCGTPVILSDTTSLPEIGGEAALFVKPDNIEDICSAMIRIIKNGYLRELLIAKGLKVSEKFTWETSAINMWNSVEKATGLINL